MPCQHLFSSFIDTSQIPDNLINYSYIFNWLDSGNIWLSKMYPSLYLFVEQFTELSPNVSCIKVYRDNFSSKLIKRNQIREKVFTHLISMTEQLKYLQVERFEWLLHVVQYIPDHLRRNAFSTVRYAEFGLPSCHKGRGDVVYIGKYLVSFLNTYMPHLQTLRLWRPDDFPWTTIRPDYKEGYYDDILILRWLNSLQTPALIAQNVAIFEQDFGQLVEELKEFAFLDIYGEIHYEKVEPYRLTLLARFPNSRIDVELSRFRLWL